MVRSRVVVRVAEVRLARAVPFVDHEVDGHLALEAADVAVAEVVAQLVDLRRAAEKRREEKSAESVVVVIVRRRHWPRGAGSFNGAGPARDRADDDDGPARGRVRTRRHLLVTAPCDPRAPTKGRLRLFRRPFSASLAHQWADAERF